ncbi:predicted protein [Streptomyces viridosporus ATCC 14672]|uniref:Predicted protein n=1 Tax=Streptomyces viridosporus (strain ATCC 14672 / DSM 40746 / JCM 4963 / KCTC 9882 / NRRL B-12104 / FH 1290) TaxID=566461 RepID=D6A4A7_STRV1|nr:hypothetical protein [Streptomyces viridosporus]EFE65747.1 predicted protein [Streptomyces viridosporus ATCC 14672]
MTAPDKYGQNVQVWQMTDPPSIPGAAQALADGIIPHTLMWFASASQRGATLTAPEEGMATWLKDANRLDIYNGSAWVTPEPSLVTSTTGLSAAAGFSVLDFFGHRQGKVVSIDLYLTRTGGKLALVNGNLPDLVAATVPSAWRPTHSTITGCWDNGIVHGGFVIGTDGIVTLRTANDDIDGGTNLRFHITFLRTT